MDDFQIIANVFLFIISIPVFLDVLAVLYVGHKAITEGTGWWGILLLLMLFNTPFLLYCGDEWRDSSAREQESAAVQRNPGPFLVDNLLLEEGVLSEDQLVSLLAEKGLDFVEVNLDKVEVKFKNQGGVENKSGYAKFSLSGQNDPLCMNYRFEFPKLNHGAKIYLKPIFCIKLELGEHSSAHYRISRESAWYSDLDHWILSHKTTGRVVVSYLNRRAGIFDKKPVKPNGYGLLTLIERIRPDANAMAHYSDRSFEVASVDINWLPTSASHLSEVLEPDRRYPPLVEDESCVGEERDYQARWVSAYQNAVKYGVWTRYDSWNNQSVIIEPRKNRISVISSNRSDMRQMWVAAGGLLILVGGDFYDSSMALYVADLKGNFRWSGLLMDSMFSSDAKDVRFQPKSYELSDTDLLVHGEYRSQSSKSVCRQMKIPLRKLREWANTNA